MLGPLLDRGAAAASAMPDALGNARRTTAPRRTASTAAATRRRARALVRASPCSATTSGGASPARSARRRGRTRRRFAERGRPAAARRRARRLVGAWTRGQSAETVMQTLQAAGIAAGVVADARDLAADPQLAARGYWVALPGRAARWTASSPGCPPRPAAVTRPGAAPRRAHRRGLARSAGGWNRVRSIACVPTASSTDGAARADCRTGGIMPREFKNSPVWHRLHRALVHARSTMR